MMTSSPAAAPVSMEEYQQLQMQLIQLKSDRYELNEEKQKLISTLDITQRKLSAFEKSLLRSESARAAAQDELQRSKDVKLRRALLDQMAGIQEDARRQTDTMRANVQHLFAENQRLQAQLEAATTTTAAAAASPTPATSAEEEEDNNNSNNTSSSVLVMTQKNAELEERMKEMRVDLERVVEKLGDAEKEKHRLAEELNRALRDLEKARHQHQHHTSMILSPSSSTDDLSSAAAAATTTTTPNNYITETPPRSIPTSSLSSPSPPQTTTNTNTPDDDQQQQQQQQQQLQNLRVNMAQMNVLLQKKDVTIARLQQQVKDYEFKVSRQEHVVAQMGQKLERADDEDLVAHHHKLLERHNDLTEQIQRTQRKLSRLQQAVREKDQELGVLREQAKMHSYTVTDLETSLQECRAQQTALANELVQQRERAHAQHEKDMTAVVSEWKGKVKEQKALVASRSAEITALRTELSNAQQDLDEFRQQIQMSAQEQQLNAAEMESLREELAAAQEQVNAKRDQDEAERKIELKKRNQLVKELQTQLKQMVLENNELRASLKGTHVKLAELQNASPAPNKAPPPPPSTPPPAYANVRNHSNNGSSDDDGGAAGAVAAAAAVITVATPSPRHLLQRSMSDIVINTSTTAAADHEAAAVAATRRVRQLEAALANQQQKVQYLEETVQTLTHDVEAKRRDLHTLVKTVKSGGLVVDRHRTLSASENTPAYLIEQLEVTLAGVLRQNDGLLLDKSHLAGEVERLAKIVYQLERQVQQLEGDLFMAREEVELHKMAADDARKLVVQMENSDNHNNNKDGDG